MEICVSLGVSLLGLVVSGISALFAYRMSKTSKKQLMADTLTKYCVRSRINDDLSYVIKYLEYVKGTKLRHEMKCPDEYQIMMFMRFLEEIELLIAENILDERNVHYMFGEYLNTIEEQKSLWENINTESEKWRIYRQFRRRMKRVNDGTEQKLSNK